MALRWSKRFSDSSQWKATADVRGNRGGLQHVLADLKACSTRKDLQWGRRVHARAAGSVNGYVATALIKMYANCGSMVDARWVFNCIQNPDVVSWTALLLGYAENGEGHLTLELFDKMKAAGCAPDCVTYIAALKACRSLAASGGATGMLERGRDIHLEIGEKPGPFVQSALIDMYAKCGSMTEARRIFDTIQKPDRVSWTTLLLGYADNGEGQVCLDLFSKMKAAGCAPNPVTYVAVFKACTSLAVTGDKAQCLEVGSRIHSEVGEHLDSYVQNTLIVMYSKCGVMSKARQVFDRMKKPDLWSWNSLLLGYAENGEGYIGLDLFSKMKAARCAPDSVTYVAVFKACTSLAVSGDGGGLELGREIHLEIGVQVNPYVQSALIDMYGKCRSMVDARRVFERIQKPDVVSWNALLLGYAENGEAQVALDMFSKMKLDECLPDSVTYVAILKACASLGDLALGRKFHADISEFSVHVVSSLVDFYAKCGSMLEAREVFDRHPKTRDISTWNSLLSGYSSCGDTASVFNLFEAMQDEAFRPEAVTFLCMLLCCSHAGLVKKARNYLEAMPVQYGVTPDVFHYNCMVDVLGRANQLDDAVSLVRRMPCSPDAVTWSALLCACRKWKNVELGRMVFQALEMNKKASSAYLLVAHLYSRSMETGTLIQETETQATDRAD